MLTACTFSENLDRFQQETQATEHRSQGSLMLLLQKDYYSLKGQMVASIFNKKVFIYF